MCIKYKLELMHTDAQYFILNVFFSYQQSLLCSSAVLLELLPFCKTVFEFQNNFF